MRRALLYLLFLTPAVPAAVVPMMAQTAPAPQATRISGTVLSASGPTITVKDQQGRTVTLSIASGAKLLKVEPGQTSLASATPMTADEIQPGDRILARGQPGTDASTLTATVVVAMKATDIAAAKTKDQQEWQHGVGGLVKSVDPAGQTVVVATNMPGVNETIKLAPNGIVKRYAEQSVAYDEAKVSSFDKILPGDQLRARGTAGPEHSFTATEIVAGTFQNISGKITAVDPAAGSVTISDLATKQPVVLRVTSDSQLKKLDDATADKLAAEMKNSGGANGQGGHSGGGQGGSRPANAGGGPPATAGTAGGGQRAGGSSGRGDLQQALSQAPVVKLSDLKKGEYVMAVASSGSDNEKGAVTLVTGVEPLLRASPNGSAAMLSSWSLGGGGGEGGGQ